MRCRHCDGELDHAFRFCPWCAAPQRSKLVEYFRAHPLIETEPLGLRASRYLSGARHVRLSIWDEDRAVAAIALEEREARRLASFIAEPVDGVSSPGTLTRLRARIDALAGELRG
ncbi:hypothetical protein [Gaiella sp.]|uniref:hypothetical protein n=1 Tax=Gaiella sp. TaxID=2663207 RepID=UPI002E304E97|nr:hypothetical protein [Gaiella sp.]HEX5584661.1 hypothetical protein [Gaiella sp.]